MKTRTVLVMLLMVAILMVSACRDGGEADTGAKKNKGNSSSEVSELVISHYYLEEERERNDMAEVFLTMVEKYEEEHPDITITQQTMSQADYSPTIQAQAAVNELPDVFMIKGSWVNDFAENGVLAPMNDFLGEYEYTDKFREGAFDAATVGGKIYGIPNQLSLSSVVFYNQKLWSQVGYDKFPTTWDDIFKAAEKFKKMGISTFSLGNKDKWVAGSCILSTLGDRYTGPEWTQSIIAKDGNAKFTDQEFVDALTLLKKMSDNRLFNADCNTITDTQAAEYYSQGLAAATISGHWEIAVLEASADEEILTNTKVALLPNIDGSEPTSFSGGCGWYFGINANLTGKKRDTAMEFLLATTGYEASVYTTETYGMPGPCSAEIDMTQFSQLTQDFAVLANTSTLTPIYDLQMDEAVIEVMNTGLQDILNGTKRPEVLANEIQEEQDKHAQ